MRKEHDPPTDNAGLAGFFLFGPMQGIHTQDLFAIWIELCKGPAGPDHTTETDVIRNFAYKPIAFGIAK